MKQLLTVLLLCGAALAQSGVPTMGSTGGATAAGNNLVFIRACNHNQTSSSTTMVMVVGTAGTCGVSANPVAGHLAFVYYVSNNQGAVTACTDTLTNTWITITNTSAGETYCTSVLTSGGSADSVTITTSNTIGGSAFYFEFSGSAAVPLDVTAQFGTVISGTTWTLPNLTTLNANDVVIGCGGNVSTNNTFTAGSGYTIPTDGQVSGGGQSGFCEYQIVNATSTYAPTVTLTAMTGLVMTVAFKSS